MEKLLMLSSLFVVALCLRGEAVRLRDSREIQYPPCFFNPLCTCSKAFPDLGKVTCRDVPLYRIPVHINASKVYVLHLENNGLRALEPHFLRNTGLYSIEISRNSLTEIPPESFAGLERSLWELNLSLNHLREVPSRAIRSLQKLKSLELSDNEIAFVSPEDWRGLEESLEVLSLRDNGLVALHPSSFSPLRNLRALDLGGNSLFAVDGNAFKDGPFNIAKLDLGDNLLSRIPYQSLAPLKSLRHLDLSFNQISEMHDSVSGHEGSPKGPTLNLDALRLDYNQIQFLPEVAFKYFATLNRTYFNGNPISDIQENAFRDVKIRELYLRDCDISELDSEAFAGLETTLRVLDLAGNNITAIPEAVFKDFHMLRELSLEENSLTEMEEDVLSHLEDSLHELDIGGDGNAPLELRKLGKLSNIRALSLSRIADGNLSPDDFEGFNIDFEELKISDGEVKALKNHAFRNVRRLKRLDLSENSISTIETDAFAEVGQFLQYLCVSHGLAPTVFKLSADALKHLTALRHLDASNNRLRQLDESSFHSMKQLKTLELQDNQIESLPRGLFQDDVHSKLTAIYLSFNAVSSVASGSFADLDSLEILRLDDNRIRTIEKKAFANLDRLKHLNLRGNKIESISHEAFENLPQLEILDLAYNNIAEFAFSCMDQVGVLSSLTLNASHNSIARLAVNSSRHSNSEEEHDTMHVNVKIMDFSHNNISYVSRSYFRQIESSLTHLYLSHNALRNITDDALGNMIHLQWLDLSHNSLKELDYAMFKNSKSLQVLKMSDNHLADVPKDIFGDLNDLRVIELADNSLKSLPDMLFKHGSVERLDLSGNQFVRVPASSFKGDAAASLMELDLSDNLIMSLHSIDIFLRFQNLNRLDLSSNPLIRIENGAFSYISRLHCLDLSNNIDIALDLKGRTFFGLDDTLEELFLRNLSLSEIPELHLPYLKSLDLSDNEITTIPAELSQNLPSLRRLELSGNQLTAIPPVINTFTHLRYLGLADNDIESVTFHRGSRLNELDIRNLPITYLQAGTLDDLQYLRTLRLSLPRNIADFNLAHLIQSNQAIEHVYIESVDDDGPPFGEEMRGTFPSKLRRLTLTGRGFKIISNDVLQGITSPRLHLVVFNTSVEDIPDAVFEGARNVRNLTVDVRMNGLRALGNPNSGARPNAPGKAFLLDLKMAGNKWTCDCELGWIEGWDRKRRQHVCEEDYPECYEADDDLRLARCDDKKSKSLLEALKTDLECGWDSKAATPRSSPMVVAVVVVSSSLVHAWIGKESSHTF